MKELVSLKKNPIIITLHKISVEMMFEAFLVGGLIRDMLLSRPCGNDYDFVISHDKNYIGNIVNMMANELKGTSFSLDADEGVYRIVVKKAISPHSFTTNRDKSKTKAFTTVDLSPLKGANIEDDLRQRDFSVNAMALGLSSLFQNNEAEIIDPLNGINDIKNHLIRVFSPHVFESDPVRLIRAFRLSALCGLQIEDKTKKIINKECFRLKNSSWERIRDEFFAILETKKARHHIQGLFASGILQQIVCDGIIKGSQEENKFATLSEIENLLDNASPFSNSLERELTAYFMETSGGVSKVAFLKFLAIMYDLWGPPAIKDGFAISNGHLSSVKSMGKKLKLSNKAQLLLTTTWHNFGKAQYLLTSSTLKDVDMYRLFRESGKDGIFIILLALASMKTEGKRFKGRMPRVAMIINYYFDQYLELVKSPLVDGSEIMNSFGISQGKKVGEILQIIEQARAEGLIGDKKEAIEYIKKM